MDYDRNDALLHHIFKLTQGDAWFRPAEENLTSGVALRVSDDPVPEYRVFPYENASLEPFEAAISKLGPAVAVKVRSAAVHAALSEAPADAETLYVDSNTRIQILDTMMQLPYADKEQSAAFIRDERVMVVWSNSLDRIIPICQDFDDSLIKLLWRTKQTGGSSMHTQSIIGGTSVSSISGHAENPVGVAAADNLVAPAVETKTKRTWYGAKRTYTVPVSSSTVEPPRKTALYAPIYNGLAAGLALVFMGNGLQTLLREFFLTYPVTSSPTPEPVGAQRYIRFALAITMPLLFCVSLFFTLQIVQNVTMAIGPVAHYHENTRFYSGIAPKPPVEQPEVLPHITIQMPVYRESLEAVLAPSIATLKRAMQTYARQGGTSSIFVCDDGLRTSGMTRADRDERIRYYRSEGVGWVARPRDGCPAGGVEDLALDNGDPEKGLGKGKKGKKGGKGTLTFHRAGRFKKASNMNYGLAMSLCMEKHLLALVDKKASGTDLNTGTTSTRGPSNLNPNNRPTSYSTVSHARRISHSYPPAPASSSGTPPLGHGSQKPRGTYGSYGMQYLNHDGDDMHVGGLSSNGSSFEGSFVGHNSSSTPNNNNNNNIVAPTPTTGGFPTVSHPLMGSPNNLSSPHPLGPGFATAAPGTPGPAADEAYYELGMEPLGQEYSYEDMEDLEEEALGMAIEEMYEESRVTSPSGESAGWKPWAANGKAMRVGEIILLVDSDTVVPEDCLRDAAREMANSPNVAIIQHESDVMQVSSNVFENGIAYVTRRINKCISMAA